MPHYEIKRHINAAPADIWAILTDAQRLSDGSFGILGIEGEIRAGETIKLRSMADPKRSFAIDVAQTSPEMVFQSGMPFGLFKGRRVYRVTPTGGGCEFHMREEYTGLLKTLMFKAIPDLNPSFKAFADGLQAAAEAA